MSEADEQLGLSDTGKVDNPESVLKPELVANPMSLINDSMFQFTMSFDPLKQLLNLILEKEKFTKAKIDNLICENYKIKETLNEYEEKFLLLELKCPITVAKYEEIDRGLYDLTDTTSFLNRRIGNTLKSETDLEGCKKTIEDTKKGFDEATRRLAEFQAQAEGFIALSQLREDRAKLDLHSDPKVAENLPVESTKHLGGQKLKDSNFSVQGEQDHNKNELNKDISIKEVSEINSNSFEFCSSFPSCYRFDTQSSVLFRLA